MARHSLSDLLEALGAVLVVAALGFWSLPWALLAAGLFLLVVANAPAGRPDAAPPGADGRRAELDEIARRAREDEQERDAVLFHLELAAMAADDETDR